MHKPCVSVFIKPVYIGQLAPMYELIVQHDLEFVDIYETVGNGLLTQDDVLKRRDIIRSLAKENGHTFIMENNPFPRPAGYPTNNCITRTLPTYCSEAELLYMG